MVARLDNIGCAASLTVSVQTLQIAFLDATAISKLVQIRLWEVGGMSWGPQNTFPSRIRQEIEDMTKEFVVDWTLDQQ